MRGMREIQKFIKDNKLSSQIFGMIHDSVEFYIHKDERAVLVPKILEIFQKSYDEFEESTWSLNWSWLTCMMRRIHKSGDLGKRFLPRGENRKLGLYNPRVL